MEKAREATDLANIRSAYAEVSANALLNDGQAEKTEGKVKINKVETVSTTGDTAYSATITLTQQEKGWKSSVTDIGGVDISKTEPLAGGTATVTVHSDGTTAPTITFSGSGS